MKLTIVYLLFISILLLSIAGCSVQSANISNRDTSAPAVTGNNTEAGTNSTFSISTTSNLSTPVIGAILPSAKGWDLYSWQERNEWHFALMIGTNRLKTIDEIISIVNTEAHFHVIGVEAINSLISRVSPENEPIVWLSRPQELYSQANPTTGENSYKSVKFSFPPQEILNNILENAKNRGVILKLYQP
jgi:hypothetical protein